MQQHMLEIQQYCKSLSSSSSSSETALQQEEQQLSRHVQEFETSLAGLQLEPQQQLWMKVHGCWSSYELFACT
jgi:hypothetical protein